MNRLIPALAAACLSAATAFAFAQTTPADAGKGPGMGPMGGHRMMKPCSEEPDRAKCEARRKEMREHMKAAHEACKDNPDRRGCMTEQMCAKAPDPAKCQEKAKERHARMSKHMDERQKMHEACTGKRGDELMKCLDEQHKGQRGHKPEAKG